MPIVKMCHYGTMGSRGEYDGLLPEITIDEDPRKYIPEGSPNPRVFFDMTLGGRPIGRMVFMLYGDKVPKAAANFLCLCTGKAGNSKVTGKYLIYRGLSFHQVVKGAVAESGDVHRNDGTGGESIYGKTFEDEKEGLDMKHDEAGVLSMANDGPDSNSSRFIVTFGPCPHLDGRHVVVGRCVSGMGTIETMETAATNEMGVPKQKIKIEDCGQVQIGENDLLPEEKAEMGPERGLTVDWLDEKAKGKAEQMASAVQEALKKRKTEPGEGSDSAPAKKSKAVMMGMLDELSESEDDEEES